MLLVMRERKAKTKLGDVLGRDFRGKRLKFARLKPNFNSTYFKGGVCT